VKRQGVQKLVRDHHALEWAEVLFGTIFVPREIDKLVANPLQPRLAARRDGRHDLPRQQPAPGSILAQGQFRRATQVCPHLQHLPGEHAPEDGMRLRRRQEIAAVARPLGRSGVVPIFGVGDDQLHEAGKADRAMPLDLFGYQLRQLGNRFVAWWRRQGAHRYQPGTSSASLPISPRRTSKPEPSAVIAYSKRARSKYCTSTPSSTISAVSGRPNFSRPPFCSQKSRNAPWIAWLVCSN